MTGTLGEGVVMRRDGRPNEHFQFDTYCLRFPVFLFGMSFLWWFRRMRQHSSVSIIMIRFISKVDRQTRIPTLLKHIQCEHLQNWASKVYSTWAFLASSFKFSLLCHPLHPDRSLIFRSFGGDLWDCAHTNYCGLPHSHLFFAAFGYLENRKIKRLSRYQSGPSLVNKRLPAYLRADWLTLARKYKQTLPAFGRGTTRRHIKSARNATFLTVLHFRLSCSTRYFWCFSCRLPLLVSSIVSFWMDFRSE